MNGERLLEAVGRLLFECGRFLAREELSSGELTWTLERRRRAEVPDALEVGLAVRSTRQRPGLLRLRRLTREGCGYQRTGRENERQGAHDTDNTTSHHTPPLVPAGRSLHPNSAVVRADLLRRRNHRQMQRHLC